MVLQTGLKTIRAKFQSPPNSRLKDFITTSVMVIVLPFLMDFLQEYGLTEKSSSCLSEWDDFASKTPKLKQICVRNAKVDADLRQKCQSCEKCGSFRKTLRVSHLIHIYRLLFRLYFVFIFLLFSSPLLSSTARVYFIIFSEINYQLLKIVYLY